MSVVILPGAALAWQDQVACDVQGQQWLEDETKLRIVRRVVQSCQQYKVRSVLDLGCGTGQYCEALGIPGYLGIDQSDKMLAVAQEMNPKARFLNARAEDAVVTESFDIGLLMHVVQHVEDGPQFLRNILERFNVRRWIFTILTVPGSAGRVFNIGDERAALAMPLDEAKRLLLSLAWDIQDTELDPSVGVEDAQELLVWTAPRI